MSEPIAPLKYASDWLANADEALQVVTDHAANAGDWGAVGWGVAVLGGLATAVKVAKFVPMLAPWAEMADQWLPRLTGRKEATIRAQADKNLDTAKGAVATAKSALAALEQLSPETYARLIAEAKELQEDLGVRDEIRAVLKGLEDE